MKEKQLQQKKRRILWGWILAVLLLSISMGTVNVQAAKLKLNKTKVTVYKGCTETLKVTGSKKKVKWSSSKKAVASVSSSGKIKWKKKGTTVIYAKFGKKTFKFKDKVTEPSTAQRLNLAKKEARKIVKKYVISNLNTKERAFVLFQYLTEHCCWQLNQSTEAYKKNYGNEAYAALILKKAACSGYARAYKLLCEAAGIPVRHVNAGSWTHQWNEIKANGKWIKVDAYGGTFADTTGIRKSLLKENKNKEQLVFKFVMEEEE